MNLVQSLDAALDAAAFRSGRADPSERIEEVCARMEEVEPAVLALLPEAGRRERLLGEASSLASRFPDPASRPPLYGLLLGVKDIFRVDGFETRAGSRLPPALFEGPEAVSVRALREAGVLILGKTVTTEFAFFAPGATRNPWNPKHTPGGSSSGSAAAVAAGFCHLALGTQTIGSISRPAAYCGVAGYKPSYGRVDSGGVLPFSPSLDHVGLFASNAPGLALGASLLGAGWRRDVRPTRRPVLAVPDGAYLRQASPEALERFESSVETLRSAGYSVLRVPALEDIQEINLRHRRIAAAEMAQSHAKLFPEYELLYSPTTRDLIREGRGIPEARMAEDLRGREKLRGELEEALSAAGADLWISPAAPGWAPEGLGSTGDPVMNLPWTHSGLPTVAFPSGVFPNGLPAGIQAAGRFGFDEELCGWCSGIETVLRES